MRKHPVHIREAYYFGTGAPITFYMRNQTASNYLLDWTSFNLFS